MKQFLTVPLILSLLSASAFAAPGRSDGGSALAMTSLTASPLGNLESRPDGNGSGTLALAQANFKANTPSVREWVRADLADNSGITYSLGVEKQSGLVEHSPDYHSATWSDLQNRPQLLFALLKSIETLDWVEVAK